MCTSIMCSIRLPVPYTTKTKIHLIPAHHMYTEVIKTSIWCTVVPVLYLYGIYITVPVYTYIFNNTSGTVLA
jgi:hypothetical protein